MNEAQVWTAIILAFVAVILVLTQISRMVDEFVARGKHERESRVFK